MSETKFTPGPWTVHHRMRDCVTFEGKFGTENLFLENREGYYACQSEYDAHLIAAAPRMYAALDALSKGEGLPPGETIERILAAARGES